MTTATRYPHLMADPDGTVRIADTRYKMLHLAGEHYHYGWTAEELMRQHPDLRPEEVYAALTYFYDHFEAMVAQFKAKADLVEAQRTPTAVSREMLLRRQTDQGG